MSDHQPDPLEQRKPKREPRPQDDNGTYRCYHDNCDREASVATPRRIESTGMDPIETVVTFCRQCYLAWEVLSITRNPLESAVKTEEKIVEEMGEQGYMKERLYPRVLANLLLFDDPRGSNPPSEDSPLGDIFDHAGKRGDRLRGKLETPIEKQLADLLGQPNETEEKSAENTDLNTFL